MTKENFIFQEAYDEETPLYKVSMKVGKLAEAYKDIRMSAPHERVKTYMHSVLCQVSLPRSPIQEREYHHECGYAGIIIKAGEIRQNGKFVKLPVPYGTRPRLVLMHLMTEAVKNKSRTIALGDSVAAFMRAIGIDMDTGGKNGSRTGFKKQVQALAACEFVIGWTGIDGADNTLWTRPVEHYRAWFADDENMQSQLFGPEITLTDSFYNHLVNHAVPHDLRAIKAIKDSALALDIYSFLAHRLNRIDTNKPVKLSWQNLVTQFSSNYSDIKNFKKKFKKALIDVQSVYPTAKVKSVDGGLILEKSPTPIEPRGISFAR